MGCSSVHEIEAKVDPSAVTLAAVEANPVRCPDPAAAAEHGRARSTPRARRGDSLGGVVECVARGVPAGLGEPVFDKLEADLAKALLSLPACEGLRDRQRLRRHPPHRHRSTTTRSCPATTAGRARARNRSGGVQGGISNGEDIVLRVAFKPTATIRLGAADRRPRRATPSTLEAQGRHDPCVLPRAVPMVEAMVLLVLADHWLRQRAVEAIPR